MKVYVNAKLRLSMSESLGTRLSMGEGMDAKLRLSMSE